MVTLFGYAFADACIFNFQVRMEMLTVFLRLFFFLPKQSQRSRSVLKDGSRSLGSLGKVKLVL